MHLNTFIGYKIEENDRLCDHQAMGMLDGRVVAVINLPESRIDFFKGKEFFDTIVLNSRNAATVRANERFMHL